MSENAWTLNNERFAMNVRTIPTPPVLRFAVRCVRRREPKCFVVAFGERDGEVNHCRSAILFHRDEELHIYQFPGGEFVFNFDAQTN